jgi:uncharacterized membrane protein YhaH (DUF805 family)
MFKGRIDRIGLLLGYVYTFAVIAIFLLLAATLNTFNKANIGDTKTIATIIYVALIIGWIAVIINLSIRRWHDMNYPGWYCLLCLLPYVGGLVSLWLLFGRGTNGPNNYGNPQSPRDFDRVLFGPRPSDTATTQKPNEVE